MKTTFSQQESLINYLLIHCKDLSDNIGLYTGLSGIVIVLCRYAKKFNLPQIDSIAEMLFDDISLNASRISRLHPELILAQVGLCVEYLVQNKLMPGPGQDICKLLDERIMHLDIKRLNNFTLHNGLLGLWHYVWARIQGNLEANLPLPFDTEYLNNWLFIINHNPSKFPANSEQRLKNAIQGALTPYSINLSEFVSNKFSMSNLNDLSVATGIAGIIQTNYL